MAAISRSFKPSLVKHDLPSLPLDVVLELLDSDLLNAKEDDVFDVIAELTQEARDAVLAEGLRSSTHTRGHAHTRHSVSSECSRRCEDECVGVWECRGSRVHRLQWEYTGTQRVCGPAERGPAARRR